MAQDSRRVQPGFIFVARRGDKVDGHQFVPKALAQGAIAVVGEASEMERSAQAWRAQVPYIQVDDDKVALAKLAATFYGHPSRSLTVVGVTGTDGKTTTSYLLHHLLSATYKTALMSTAGLKLGETLLDEEVGFTTPEATEVQGILARFREAGCTHVVLESSSHGLAYHRLDEVDYDLAVWTNLSPEHIEHHGSFEAYREAKLTLMRRAPISVLNADEEAYLHFAEASAEVVRYGLDDSAAEWRALELQQHLGELHWQLRTPDAEAPARLPMIGGYNVYNALAALAAAHRLGLELDTLLARLATFPGVPGRMQVVQTEPFTVLVDFAHTIAGLKKVLETLREATPGRLIVLTGATGERAPEKRAPLAEVAVQSADLAVFSEDDPRSDDIHEILADMSAGAEAAGGTRDQTFFPVADRREAINQAIALAQPGDTVLLAGKGHERTLKRKHETLPWDEVGEALRALEERSER